jgi:hypothetical protein
VVQDDLGLRERAGQVHQVQQLRLEQPRVEGQPERGELGETPAELLVEQQAWRRQGKLSEDRPIGVPRRHLPDALEPAVPRPDMGLQHLLDGVTEPARAHRRDAVDELGLADRRQLRRRIGPVHRVALREHGGSDVVTAVEIGEQVVEQVAGHPDVLALEPGQVVVGERTAEADRVAHSPEMVVGIDDRQVRLQRGLDRQDRDGG